MNNQEQAQLTQFLNQLVDVKLTEKDSAAETLIREAIARQPDAAYLLVQRCLLQDQAVATAQTKINTLEHQLQQQRPTTPTGSFINGDPWAQTSGNSNGVPGANSYQVPNAQAFSRTPPQNQGAGIGSSFLGNIATTAAGVVAGSFLFQGIENLMGHHQSAFGQQASSDQPTEQNIVNNYYGDDQQPDSNSDYLASDDSDGFFDAGDSDSDWV